MAVASEVQSLNDINYRPRIKVFLLILLGVFVFIASFLRFYPIGDKLKAQIKTHMRGGCNPDFDQIRLEFFMPKIVISDLTLPANCLGREGGDPLKFSFVKLNYHLINFSPFGLPFRLDTEVSGQPLSLHYVVGFNQQMIRLKDQTIVLSRLQSLLGNIKLAGSVTVDLNLLMSKNIMKNLTFKAVSNDFQLPSQSIQSFTVPNLKLNKFYAEAHSEAHPLVTVERITIGDVNAPVRAEFKGTIELQEGNINFSPINLLGEIAFSESFKNSVPILDMMFQSFSRKDDFYQIRLGGTLGNPKPINP